MAAPDEHPFDTTLIDEALRLSEAERLALSERLWRDYLVLNPDQPRGFFVQFESTAPSFVFLTRSSVRTRRRAPIHQAARL
jgi:hypothetical protein